jgi:predicted RNase H-like HicB family nuclease
VRGYFVAEITVLTWLYLTGKTKAEALANIKEAANFAWNAERRRLDYT